ncbi:hypothetical protein [Cypionkella sp. TWP1-2-1b2]|uniref:hypothetical protein n=1 Tax=Cypionkella sp. TWP1-2-1b2 TaxID=2804675 RepID=UPI003CFA2B59
MISHVIVAVTLGIPTIILLESFLGFLGFAVKPALISWDMMLQNAGSFSASVPTRGFCRPQVSCCSPSSPSTR